MSQIYIALDDLGELGGLQTASRALAEEFRRQGHEVEYITIRPCSEPVNWLFRSGFAAALRRLGLTGMKPERLDPVGRSKYARALEKLITDRPGHIICMDVYSAQLISSARRMNESRRTLQFHNSFTAAQGTNFLSGIKKAQGQFDAFVALTEADAKAFTEETGNHWVAIPNVLRFPRALPSSSRSKRVVSIGRLTHAKRVDLLIAAWARIPAVARKSWALDIIGDGPDQASLEQIAADLGIADSVHFLGRRSDVQAILDDASVYALTSEYEGLPMGIAEAISRGVPCVATDSAPGIHELLGDDAGLIVPVGDVEAIAIALERLISDPEERFLLATRGFERSSKFDSLNIISRWKQVLRIED